tara:strand:- start:3051 stop:3422 length:372 start_codon:yes stop_codon:yes gene_type:complete
MKKDQVNHGNLHPINKEEKMKKWITGLTIGIILTTVLVINLSAEPAEDDSVKYYMNLLEEMFKKEVAKNVASGRFQLQSFSIDRTHWHYMLDTSTGELYMMEKGRTPARSEWVLIANGLSEEE